MSRENNPDDAFAAKWDVTAAVDIHDNSQPDVTVDAEKVGFNYPPQVAPTWKFGPIGLKVDSGE